jgi:hypothetical protein
MKKKKRITKKEYIENNAKVLTFVAQLIVCGCLLAVIIYSLPL